jgi:Zn-dependent protease with chaperone function
MGDQLVNLRHCLILLLGCCAVSHAAQSPIAEIRLRPTVRGNLTVTIETWDAPGVQVESIRGVTLPCDWKPDITHDDIVSGVCRHYLSSDGTSAAGTLNLILPVIAMRHAGIESVRVLIEDDHHLIAQTPQGWLHETSDEAAKRKSGRRGGNTFWFVSEKDEDLPLPFPLRIGTPWSPSQALLPIAFTLFGPGLLALWLRRRAERSGATESAAVWVHWILTATWLYWIYSASSQNVSALIAHLGIENLFVSFVMGAILMAAPPLFAVASCVAILLRAPEGDPEPQDTVSLIKRAVARESVLMVPFSIFLGGTASVEQDWKMGALSMVVAYVVYRLLSWYVGRWTMRGLEILTRGELWEATSALAARAGVTLSSVYILGNRNPMEANAFAAGGRMMGVTRGLVENLTRRELSAVIGHEVGHLRGKHVGMSTLAFWGYMILMQPLAVALTKYAHVPVWVLSLPVLPLVYIFGTSLLSRRNEFNADGRAVEITGDPEAMIAALARLRKLTRTPVDWGGMQGSILSHPSMRDRVLSIARRGGVTAQRALALLDNPDLLNEGEVSELRHFGLPAECAGAERVYNSASKATYLMWAGWLDQIALVVFALAVTTFAYEIWPRMPFSALLSMASIPLLTAAYLIFTNWVGRCFKASLRRKLAMRMGAAADGGTFVGLLPGSLPLPVEGFYHWDLGFLWLNANELVYRGERATFALPRASVRAITICKGPISWDRVKLVRVECEGGALQFSRPDTGTTQRHARRLERRLQAWLLGTSAETAWTATEPAPPASVLRAMSTDCLRGWQMLRISLVRTFLMLMGLTLLMPLVQGRVRGVSVVAIIAPAAYAIAGLPLWFRRKPVAEPAPAAPAEVDAPQPAASPRLGSAASA